jgi:hypothetical protein
MTSKLRGSKYYNWLADYVGGKLFGKKWQAIVDVLNYIVLLFSGVNVILKLIIQIIVRVAM